MVVRTFWIWMSLLFGLGIYTGSSETCSSYCNATGHYVPSFGCDPYFCCGWESSKYCCNDYYDKISNWRNLSGVRDGDCPAQRPAIEKGKTQPGPSGLLEWFKQNFGYLLAGYFGFCALLLIVLSLVIYIGRETCARRLITPVDTYMYDTDEAEDHDEKDTENVESTAKSKRIKKNPPPFNPNKPSFKAWMMKRTAKVAPATSGVTNKIKPV